MKTITSLAIFGIVNAVEENELPRKPECNFGLIPRLIGSSTYDCQTNPSIY